MRAILAALAATIIRLLRLTWRVRILGPDPDYASGPLVFCFWHGHQAGLFAHPRPRQVVVLSSLSRDGGLQARILSSLGFIVVRGSSSHRGAGGLKGLIDQVRCGKDAAFAVDGPRGPTHQVKSGAVLAAQRAGAALVPITSRASRSWTFSRAWDRYQLPKPFARVELVRGPLIPVCEEELDSTLLRLEAALLQLTTEWAAGHKPRQAIG